MPVGRWLPLEGGIEFDPLTLLLLAHRVPEVHRPALDETVYLFICDPIFEVYTVDLFIYVADSLLSFIAHPLGLRSLELPDHKPILRQGWRYKIVIVDFDIVDGARMAFEFLVHGYGFDFLEWLA